jgi:hypothetical protein
MFCPKRDELTEDGWSLHDDRFHELPAQNIFRVKRIEGTNEVHIDFGGETRGNLYI